GTSGLDHPAPAVVVEFAANGAPFADDGERELVWRLVLIETVIRQDRTMTREEMHGVLDFDAFENQVGGIDDQTVHRPAQPFASIDDVSERVLDGAAAGGAVGVVDTAVGRTVGGEVLATHGHELDGPTEPTREDGLSHGRKQRMTAVDIGHPDLQ